ncbi:membrane-spanning protein [Fictibacillus sp. Mic-4]|uniref:hypothetical protein n=1 Tax=Fictibacillus TaxID=1329200 RepID=UPI000407E106|nr:hypothetical protein [Fictibacillus gelatini]
MALKQKIIIIFSEILIVFFAVLFIVYFMKDDSSRWQVALGGIGVSAVPLFLLFLKNNPFNIPSLLGYYVLIFCTTYLGSIESFYLKYKWWDSSLHFYKGILVSYIGITLYQVLIPQPVRKGISRWIFFLFLLSLAVTATVLWEIYEFAGDQFFTHTMQRGGNKDTMYDLICGLTGGFLLSLYFSLKTQKIRG